MEKVKEFIGNDLIDYVNFEKEFKAEEVILIVFEKAENSQVLVKTGKGSYLEAREAFLSNDIRPGFKIIGVRYEGIVERSTEWTWPIRERDIWQTYLCFADLEDDPF